MPFWILHGVYKCNVAYVRPLFNICLLIYNILFILKDIIDYGAI
jgi:hypothetical protein